MIVHVESESSTMAHDYLVPKWSLSEEIRAFRTGIDALESEKNCEEAEKEYHNTYSMAEESRKIWEPARENLRLKSSETGETFKENSCSCP